MDADMEIDTEGPTTAPPSSAPLSSTSPPASSAGSGTGTGSTKPAEPRRRNRPALSCIQCRTRKIKCDRSEPCGSCQRSKIVNCTYEEARRPKPRLWRISPARTTAQLAHSPPSAEERSVAGPGLGPGSAPSSAPASGFAFRDVSHGPVSQSPARGPFTSPVAAANPGVSVSEPVPQAASPVARHVDSTPGKPPSPSGPADLAEMAEKIRQMQQQLEDTRKQFNNSQSVSHSVPAVASSQQQRMLPAMGQNTVSKDLMESDWINGDKLFPLISSVARRVELDAASEAYFVLQKCKSLNKFVRSQRLPTHPSSRLGESIPPEITARRLVEAYFRTFESVYRILHRPTFWSEYQRYWENPEACSQGFVVQFQLCMAIGTCFQDDFVSFRHAAAGWINDAQVWLASVSETPRMMSYTGLQVGCLLHLARETCGVNGDLSWIGAGSLLRTAMHMGLHRDPDHLPEMSVFCAEMRRRLWATVVEMSLQASLDSGGPPLLVLDDFDTRQPSNFDDDQLERDKTSATPRPLGTFTQTTVQLALLRSFPVRLAIAQYVNHFGTRATYDQTLSWNTELTKACRALSATLQPSYDPTGVFPKRLSLFQLRLAEHMVHRFFLVLNHPWMCLAQTNKEYYFARKMCVETSLKLHRAFAAGSPAGDSGTASQRDDFTRLATYGGGAFRSVPSLAVLTLCLELLWQAQEDRSFHTLNIEHQLDRPHPGESDMSPSGIIGSGAAPRQDLLEAVKYSIGWAERRIQAGETNFKEYILYSALLSQVSALQRGASDAEIERLVLDSVTDSLGQYWRLLGGSTSNGNAIDHMATAPDTDKPPNGRLAPGDGRGSKGEARGGGWCLDDVMPKHRFNSIFNFHEADFLIGT